MPLSPEDASFLDEFEACRVSKACWTHEAHIRMAWLQLERWGNFATALERIRTGIQTFNAAQASMGYHETVTVAFARLIALRRRSAPPGEGWREFLVRNPDLLAKSPPVLERHYSRERLFSEAARTGWVAPDREPLPE